MANITLLLKYEKVKLIYRTTKQVWGIPHISEFNRKISYKSKKFC